MNVVGTLLSKVGGYWNPSTLSGAIDVLVVEQPDGSLLGSPFHARFGKRGVLRPRDNAVELFVNNEPVSGLSARLGSAGEVIFNSQPLPPAPTDSSELLAIDYDEWVHISTESVGEAAALGTIDSGHFSEPDSAGAAGGRPAGRSRWFDWRWGRLPRQPPPPAASTSSLLSVSTPASPSASSSSLKSQDDAISCFDADAGKQSGSVRLSSEQLGRLRLRPGHNTLRYEVTTKYQGTACCACSVFLWRHDDRIVISDIDGTITRSDLLGQLLPMVGKDWIQPTVARLFSAVSRNGYKFLFLSSRGLGQSDATRKFLDGIKQEELQLPEGPVLLSPATLLAAFHREVIARRPQDFKISCLSDIRALFRASAPGSPFWAGFGNRATDADTYAFVGIPPERCFTVNSRGQLLGGSRCHPDSKCGLATSYQALVDMVDHIFPARPWSNILEMGEYGKADVYSDATSDAIADVVDSPIDAAKRRRRSSSTLQAVCISEVNFYA